MRIWLWVIILVFLTGIFLLIRHPKPVLESEKIAEEYSDKSLFLTPIKNSGEISDDRYITGITVPHHLLAADLTARAFKDAAGTSHAQIILISPDHYNLGKTVISTTVKNWSTVFGELESDKAAAAKLEELPMISEENFFYREHGVGAVLPFIKYFFPESKIVVLTIKTSITKEETDKLLDYIKEIIKTDTLVVQSTDFSHYLSADKADLADRQTLDQIYSENAEGIWGLDQPDNLDCKACQYLQMKLQKDVWGSGFTLLFHRNSQDYTKNKLDSTTSYLVQEYKKNTGRMIFGGDVMLSRGIGNLMSKRNDYDFPWKKIEGLLKTADLVFANLESPISDQGSDSGKLFSFRADKKVVSGLKTAGFKAMSIANNHIWDYGKNAFEDTLINLTSNNILPVGSNLMGNKETINVQGTEVAFLGYTNLLKAPGVNFLELQKVVEDIKNAKKSADVVIVSIHWGQEYKSAESAAQISLAHEIIDAGADMVVGHHPHVVQNVEKYQGKYIAYSLGNFVFDQNFADETSHGLLLRVDLSGKKITNMEQIRIGFTSLYQPEVNVLRF